MQRRAVKEEDGGVFSGYKEWHYLQKIKALHQKKTLTPKNLEQSPYKLHISLTESDYLEYQNEIITVLLNHLKKGATNDFKYTNYYALKNKIAKAKSIVSLINQYYAIRLSDEFTREWKKNFVTAINRYFHGECVKFPKKSVIKKILFHLTQTIIASQRLLSGDQFTVYIPENFDKTAVLNLCLEINSYLNKNKATAGTMVDVESPVTRYLSLRQEYLLEDFQAINNLEVERLDRRIDAVADPNQPFDKRRHQVIIEQQQSSLYQYLCRHLNPKPLSRCSLFSYIHQKRSGKMHEIHSYEPR